MLTKIKSKSDETGLPNRSLQRKAKPLVARTLVISGIVLLLLLISIIYYGIVLERFVELKQIVSHNRRYNSESYTPTNIDLDSINTLIRIPDSEMVIIEQSNIVQQAGTSKTTDYAKGLQHGLLKFSRRRLSRGLRDLLDPLSMRFMPEYETLKSKVRNKRTQIALSKLEKEYIRCKKASHSNNDCMTEFVRLYKVAKEVSEKMEKMVEMFKDSELVLQQSSSSNSEELPSIENVTTETDVQKENTTTKFKISWIIDGNDDVELVEQKTTTQHITTTVKVTEVNNQTSLPTTESIVNVTSEKDAFTNETTNLPESTTKSVKVEKFGWILNVKDSTESNETTTDVVTETLNQKSTVQTTTDNSENDPIHTTQFIADEDSNTTGSMDKVTITVSITEPSTTPNEADTSISSVTQLIETSTPSMRRDEENKEDEEEVRKMTFDWIIDGGDASIAEESNNDTQYSPKTEESFATTTKTKSYATTLKPFKYSWIVDSDVVSDERTTTNQTSTPLTNSSQEHIRNGNPFTKEFLNKTDEKRFEEARHPLDYPTSLENTLGSFEKSDTLKPLKPQANINESDLYDPVKWAQTFKEAAAKSYQSDLVESFDVQSTAHLGPKLNPANMKALSAEDTELLSLCERMVQRLRNKGNSNSALVDLKSDGSTQTPTVQTVQQFSNRGPLGFPVTGESMKASAQFMFNPNFGMPSIPICFYLTPANFRMPTAMAPSWPSPYMNTPNFFGAPSGSFLGAGGGPGTGSVFFTPQNFGGTGNFFGSGPGSSMFPNVPNFQNFPNNPNMFPKNAPLQKQQFYCTYTQNNANQGIGVQSTNKNPNAKLRTSNQTSPVNIIYASYAGMPAQPDHKASFKCELPDQVACYGGNECINEDSWCDGSINCSDGSDEATCSCSDRLATARVCDGYPDCPMGEDEVGCYGCDHFMYSCYANAEEYERFNRSTVSMCYSSMEKCDGFTNCLNGRDELECSILVSDLTNNHMSHSVSAAEGFLYQNHRGQWYPVCNNGKSWAEEACKSEGGYTGAPNTTYREFSLPGPFIEPSILSDKHFPQSCQKRNDKDTLVDHVTYVKCAPSKCGNRKKNVDTSMRPKSKRLQRLQKRIVDNKGADDEDSKETGGRIVGGKYSKPLEWPFVIALYRNGNFHCGGTIFSERWVISAAHCVINYQKYYYEVRAGMLRRSSYSMGTQIQAVSHIVVHQAYERRSMRNDLSLLRLAEPLRFNRWIKPICLPDMGRTTSGDDWIWGPESDTLCTAVGWGAVREKGPGSEQLREVVIPIRKGCSEKPDQESENICAGDAEGGHDACQGDSGGPLFCQSVSNSEEWYLAGVVSHGNGCARPGEFGVYTRVALYLDWIEMATMPKMLPKLQPVQTCPGYTCIWGGKRCIPQRKRCNRIVDCLGGEDEVGCVYNFVPDVGSPLNMTTTESDYFPEEETTTQGMLQLAQNSLPDDFMDNKKMFLTQALQNTSTVEDNIEDSLKELTVSTISVLTEEISTETNLFTPTVTVSVENTTQNIVLSTSAEESIKSEQLQSSHSSVTTTEATEESCTSTHTTAATTTEVKDVEVKTTSTSKQTETIATTPSPPTNVPEIPNKFVCRRIPQIIDVQHRCDRLVDCEDGTDEELCSCRDYLKGTLNILVCDGKVDCEDETDESDCGFCKHDEFRCPLSKTCLPLKKRCDNVIDCQFKEDEKDCFALTDGVALSSNINKQPVFKNSGIFTRNKNGIWRIVCAHETTFRIHGAATANEICALLGFKGFKFYNTTSSIASDKLVVPVEPDIARLSSLKPHLSATVEDNTNFFSNENFYSIESKTKVHTERILAMQSVCLGLYVECNPISNRTEPLKTLSAGEKPNIQDPTTPKLKPLLITHARPNVYVKPETSPIQLIEQTITDYQSKANMSVLVNNELHEAVEDLHWPWLVDIYANGRLWCAGVLLDKHWVMVHESCYFGVRLNTDYIVGLFGGGKSKNVPHKSLSEQIERVDCFQSVPDTDIILYHLEHPVHFSQHVLPIFLPEADFFNASQHRDCMALIHDNKFGRFKAVSITAHKNSENCSVDASNCYRLMENTQLERFSVTVNEEQSQSKNCTQFGTHAATHREIIEPIDQGILVCHSKENSWFPTGLFSYNNTDCQSFREPFNIRTLENVFDNIQNIIDQPKCNFRYNEPSCQTFRCPLGRCLSSEEVCNGQTDCHDGSDEETEFCLDFKKVCGPGEMQCRSSKKCIPKTKFCDHIPDCEDFTDEPTICSCFTYLRATDPNKICDGIRNCWDKSDESPALCNCTSQLFSCGLTSEECVPHDFVCDKEQDCPNGEDERYCYGIEQPLVRPNQNNDPVHLDPQKAPKYGQVIEQSYGIWHTKCFPRSSPPDISEVRQICKKLGYSPYRQPSYRLIDDAAGEIVETNETIFDKKSRSFGDDTIVGKYRDATKAVVASKFSPLHLNDELILFMKPSRPIAELVRWNATDSSRCFRLEIRCG